MKNLERNITIILLCEIGMTVCLVLLVLILIL